MGEIIEVDFEKKKKLYKLTYTDAIKRQKFMELEQKILEIKILIPFISGRGTQTLQHMKMLDVMTRNLWEHLQ